MQELTAEQIRNRAACKRWRDKNKEREANRQREYVAANRSRINQRTVDYRAENPEKVKDYNLRARAKQTTERRMWHGAKDRARQKGLECTITVEDIHIPTHCPILGIELFTNPVVPSDNSPSLDRIVCELGYVKDNVQVISHKANRIKGHLSLDEVQKLLAYMTSH